MSYLFNDEWTDLYQTWNLAFVTGNLTDLHIIYPKLLIPSVINASSDDYLFHRALSLWPTANFVLFNKSKGIESLAFAQQEELAQLWGQINVKYAYDYVEEHNGIYLGDFVNVLKLSTKKIIKAVFGN